MMFGKWNLEYSATLSVCYTEDKHVSANCISQANIIYYCFNVIIFPYILTTSELQMQVE